MVLPEERMLELHKVEYTERHIAEQLKLLATNGMLVKCSLAVSEGKVLVGFKEAEWEALR